MDHVVFTFVYLPGPNTDLRTFSVYELPKAQCSISTRTEHYKFYHPVTGLNIGITNFYRHNLTTGSFEPAGTIEWLSNYNATIHFGIDEVSIQELRKVKQPGSASRRFKVDGIWYKWKMAETGQDLYCADNRGSFVASWQQSERQLTVSVRAMPLLDRLVVTCMLNLWMRHLGEW